MKIGGRLIVRSTPMCAPCEQLERFPAERGVRLVSEDPVMDEDAADLIQRSDIRTVPVLGVDGRLYAGADLSRSRLRHVPGL